MCQSLQLVPTQTWTLAGGQSLHMPYRPDPVRITDHVVRQGGGACKEGREGNAFLTPTLSAHLAVVAGHGLGLLR